MPFLRAGAALVAVLTVAACGSAAPPAAGPSVVATTDVYGAVASAVGGPGLPITSLIRSADADPHEYEPTPADALAVSRATVFIANGDGYDDFASKLYDAASAKPISVVVTSLSGGDSDAPDFNEHVWYDLPTVKKLADYLATSLGAADQPNANRYLDNAKKFDAQVDGLMTKVAAIKAKHAGVKVAITEPVPGYLLDAAGLVVVTPPEFSEAVEEGTDPPAAVVTANNATFAEAKVLVENAQTTGPITTQAEQAAAANRVPVVKVTETLPDGVTDYVFWMSGQVDALAAALDAS